MLKISRVGVLFIPTLFILVGSSGYHWLLGDKTFCSTGEKP